MVSTYEPDENGVERLVYREMNDEEYADHKARKKEWKNRDQRHPFLKQVESMSTEERDELRKLLGS
jgi:hypothetical protein